jgi:hypothetical protein
MNYYPYFRGKQFELLTIRESSQVLANSCFVPIIEPVRESLGGLQKALDAICDAGGKAIVIINPYHGDHQEDGTGISNLLQKGYVGNEAISAGILLRSDMRIDDAKGCYDSHSFQNPTVIHDGFTEPKKFAEHLGRGMIDSRHVFIEKNATTLYRKHFKEGTRILARDGFKQKDRNADYALLEPFSDLHVTYKEDMGMDGFGDFLIVGDTYSEGGGPAYAVAIHLTFIDPDKDDEMYIYHFVSTTRDTPADPAGKFAQALKKLIGILDSGHSKIRETSAITEFRELHRKGHFPGLGYVKKLSMKHHIETLAAYPG